MRKRLSSYRFRRRLLRVTVLLVAVGAGGVVSVLFWNTAYVPPRQFSNVPAQTFVEPVRVPLTAENRKAALAVAAKFLRTAVRRERMDEAFELVTPQLKGGLTRVEWRTGDVPVVPYPVDAARWSFDYSFQGEIGLQVYVFPEPGQSLRPTIFYMSLKSVRDGEGERWLVDTWYPRAGPGGVSRTARTDGNRFDLSPPRGPAKSRLGAEWLLFPFLLVAGTLLLIPSLLLVRERRRSRRAREHAAAWEARARESS